ncbi:MAG: hypothetical protein AAGC99_14165, partial [Pseudomonadota bacterium]
DQPDTVDLTALQWLNRKEPRASEKNRHHHRSVKKSETSKRFVTTKNRNSHNRATQPCHPSATLKLVIKGRHTQDAGQNLEVQDASG